MMTRVFLVLVLAVAASAVNLQHALPKLKQGDSPFAQAVLAELNDHLAAGGPADELLKIINDIRDRVAAAEQSDADGWTNRKIKCNAEKARLTTEIGQKEAEIAKNERDQDKAKAEIENYTNIYKEKNASAVQKAVEIQQAKDQIQVLQEKRDYDAEVFQNRTADTEECIKAINEILGLDHDLLAARQDDTSTAVNNIYDYEKKSTSIATIPPSTQAELDAAGAALLSVASKLHSKSAQALMQQALGNKANYDDLKQLLDKLLAELEKYQKELADDEDAAIAQFEVDMAAAKKVLADRQAEYAQLIKERDEALANLQTWNGRLADLQEQHAKLTEELRLLNVALDNWTETCAFQEKEYQQRVADRQAENDTLDAIEKLIRERLGHLLDENDASSTKTQDDVQNRLEGGNGGLPA